MGRYGGGLVIGNKIYDFPKGVENWKNAMKSYFPNETEAIDRYVELVFEISKSSRQFFSEKAMPGYVQKLAGNRMRKDYLKYASRTTLSVLQELTSDKELIKVLTGQYGDYGLPPAKSSFAMHISISKHYFNGGCFPVGGSSRIVETIDPIIEKGGGTILINAEVDEVIIEKNQAKGVRLSDAREIKGDVVISGTGIMNTYKKLLPPSIVQKHSLSEQLKPLTPSAAHASLYIGLNGSPEELALPKANFWIYPDDLDHDACVERFEQDQDAPFPVVYISFPSSKDPTWSDRYPGKSTIDIITVMPYDVFQKWEDKRWKKRGEDYENLKEKFAQRLLNVLYEKLPHVKDKIDYYELSSPVTTRHFMNYDQGELYGIDHNPERYNQRVLQPKTPIKNFYLTGQDIVSAGVAGALFAGFLTASAIMKKNIVKERLF